MQTENPYEPPQVIENAETPKLRKLSGPLLLAILIGSIVGFVIPIVSSFIGK